MGNVFVKMGFTWRTNNVSHVQPTTPIVSNALRILRALGSFVHNAIKGVTFKDLSAQNATRG